MMMKGLVIGGATLALIGVLMLAIPVFTTQSTNDLAKIGDLKLQATESRSYVIPTLVSGGALVLGVVLIGAGLLQRR